MRNVEHWSNWLRVGARDIYFGGFWFDIDPLPFPAGTDDCVGVQQLIASITLVLADILSRCDHSLPKVL